MGQSIGRGKLTVHQFSQSLALSKLQENAAWWPLVYNSAFPGHLSAVSVRDDGWAQRGGIDRVITLKSGKVVTVDEKVRSKSYGDIALERWSDKARKTPGWMQKDLACDYIAYAFVPDQRCYLLSFLSLRSAWIKNGRDWITRAEANADGFRVVTAKNTSYVTESIAVPIPKLLTALQQTQVIEWNSQQEAA